MGYLQIFNFEKSVVYLLLLQKYFSFEAYGSDPPIIKRIRFNHFLQ